ncbi:polysaccharide deacetylase family protein [Salinigranum marinum]|uniref:polysaccharide deacetylase family protein n=1 Tax=Salinigranum marinum TaxID=1515595 RepID=UPI002989A4C3|nr:polysaccharide deacetylase family protein [Salinigranum marinum]
MPDPDHSFALCLTHDVDRPYKTWAQSAYYALAERDPAHLTSLRPGTRPYWQFERIMRLEDELGVRSAFYFLNEPHLFGQGPSVWTDPTRWIQHLGRYDLARPEIVDVIHALDEGGWEVGLHGSYGSYADPDRLASETRVLESVLGHGVDGVRQHYLNLDGTDTWRAQRELGFNYDASLGSATEYGFANGYGVHRPFDDEFVTFPLTAMEVALPDPGESFERAATECDRLVEEAADNDAVMTVLWHPRFFNEQEFPGFGRLYRHLVEQAKERGAWVGPPGELYESLGPERLSRPAFA